MDVEAARAFMLSLAHVRETVQWGDNLVLWVGDKALGGKMFALAPLHGEGDLVISFAAGPERFAELLEREGFRPAPYLARAHWIAVERWSALRTAEWQDVLQQARAWVWSRMSAKTQQVLSLPAREQQNLIAQAQRARAELSGAGRRSRSAVTSRKSPGRNKT